MGRVRQRVVFSKDDVDADECLHRRPPAASGYFTVAQAAADRMRSARATGTCPPTGIAGRSGHDALDPHRAQLPALARHESI